MSDDVIFGDIERADVWDADPTIAPEQVARRLHTLRVEVDNLGGTTSPRWTDLDPESQELAEAIGEVVVDWIEVHEPDNPALTARRIHDVRVYLSRGVVPPWDSLAPDEQQIGIDLIRLVIEWLDKEGPR